MNAIIKFRDIVSKVIITDDSKAADVQDILGWLKPTIENGATAVVYKEPKGK